MRDGQFNPDAREVNDIGNFEDMANAVLYNALAWALTSSSSGAEAKSDSSGYAARVAQFVQTWFLDDATAMTPNLAYAQMQRGPTGQNGTHTGILCVFTTCLPPPPFVSGFSSRWVVSHLAPRGSTASMPASVRFMRSDGSTTGLLRSLAVPLPSRAGAATDGLGRPRRPSSGRTLEARPPIAHQSRALASKPPPRSSITDR